VKGFNNNIMNINSMGEIVVSNHPNVDGTVKFSNVSIIPEAATNLLSVGQICKKNCKIIFDHEKAIVIDKGTNKILMKFDEQNGLYVINLEFPVVQNVFTVLPTSIDPLVEVSKPSEQKVNEIRTLETKNINGILYLEKVYNHLKNLHRIFGHINFIKLKAMIKHNCVDGLELDGKILNSYDITLVEKYKNGDLCTECIFGKAHRAAFSKSRPEQYLAKEKLSCVHADLSGMIKQNNEDSLPGLEIFSYVLTIIDEWSRMVFTFPLKKKSEATKIIINWLTLIQNQTGLKCKRFHSDQGTEFLTNELKNYCQTNCLYTTKKFIS
jgi:hypothetical protein